MTIDMTGEPSVSIRLPEGPADRFALTFPADGDGIETVRQIFEQSRLAMCISDPSAPDNPIVYVNAAFVALTGYAATDVIGRNCRFLQGPGTDPATRREVAKAIQAREIVVTEIVNHRRDGTPFWNALHVGPIYDQHGQLRFFFGSQWDVSDVHAAREREAASQRNAMDADRRTSQLLAVVSSIVGVSASGATDARAAAEKARRRIAAIGRAHAAVGRATQARSNLHDVVDSILELAAEDGASKVSVRGKAAMLNADAVTPVGLTLHEMAQNSREHGTLGGRADAAELGWRVTQDADGRFLIEWQEVGVAGPIGPDGIGRRIMQAMAATMGGTLESEVRGRNIAVRLDLPRKVLADA